MALPLVKVGILVGAGVLGSYLAKEGRVSDVVSGAFKIAWKQIRDDKSNTPSVKKPSNDALMAQMNKIRQELQSYSSSGPITIVTGSRTGASRYVIMIIVVVAGYGYFWWKGWKLPDMMFATRRSLGDAGKSFSKQIDGVFSSISVTRRQLSSNLDGVDRNLAESIETTASTQKEVVELRGKTEYISTDFKEVQEAVMDLETKINRLDGKQDPITAGVFKLCDFAHNSVNSRTTERIQASSSNSPRRCIELPPDAPSSLVTPLKSSRPALELPPASPSRNNGISEVFGPSALESTSNGPSSSGRFGFKYPASNTKVIQRTKSATIKMLPQNRSASGQF
ncbi:uncharacterized protein LOC126790276 isoform X2 [Argentina anserina]|uniref:uncharacterized protein LOC126790276 isoform X2 n=1 Tax=Argentina anserina TaxID=57926 RepID=UPI0021764B78|nr:uncharacterized protein LOC126790276 isoform X2 [Potentilla anserina]